MSHITRYSRMKSNSARRSLRPAVSGLWSKKQSPCCENNFLQQHQGCIFCWKVVTKGHHLKFWCGRYKEGMVEGISLPSFLFPPTFQPFNPLTFHHFHPLTFQPFHPLTFHPFNLLTFQPFHPLIFIPFYPPTSELSALQPSNLSILWPSYLFTLWPSSNSDLRPKGKNCLRWKV